MGVNNAGRQEEVDHQREPEHSPAKEGYRSDRNVSELSSSAWIEPASEQKKYLGTLLPSSQPSTHIPFAFSLDPHAGTICMQDASRVGAAQASVDGLAAQA